MRSAYTVFFIGCLTLLFFVFVTTWVSSGPETAAHAFLRVLKTGRLSEAAQWLGDHTCRCPPRGGWASLIKYEWGQEPNMAFLAGSQFGIGRPRVTWLKDDSPFIVPWENPESTYVDVPLVFETARPYFLPLDLAYGYDMPLSALKAYAADPVKDDWKGFSSRLRQSLKPGTVPPRPPAPEHAPADDLARELLPEGGGRYLTPRDCARVLGDGGEPVDINDVERILPRLRSVTLRLNVVRRGQFKPWRIAKVKYMDAIVETEGRQPVRLLNPASRLAGP